MNETNISPLARRLAEENNVDWRSLNGSGTDGKVVERDVLEYLARVMAGQEDTNPTPEPLPPGIESWPEADIAAFKREMADAGKNVDLSDLQAKLSAADRSTPTLPGDLTPMPADEPASFAFEDSDDLLEIDDGDDGFAPTPEVPHGEPVVEIKVTDDADTDDISEDIFLFEEGNQQGATDDASYGAADRVRDPFEAAALDEGPSAESPLTEDPFAEGLSAEAPFVSEGEAPAVETLGADDPFAAEALGVTGDGADEGDDIFVDLDDDGTDADVSGDDFFDDMPGASAGDDPFSADFSDSPEDDLGFGAEGDEGAAGEPEGLLDPFGAADKTDDYASGDGAVAGMAGADAVGEDEVFASAPSFGVDAVETAAGGAARATAVVDDTPPTTASQPDSSDAAASTLENTPSLEEALSREGAPSHGADHERAEGGADDGNAIGAETTTVVPGLPVTLPLVSYGTLLRRHLDLTSLAEAQLAVGRELGEEEPIAPTAFLMRAAGKALDAFPLVDGELGLVSLHSGGLGLRRLDRITDGGFLALVREVRGDAAEAADVAMAVADMSSYEVDEAVLDLGMPLLTLGRVMYDTNEARYHSTLSLSGEISPEEGARFLARVGELLASPIRLAI